MTAEGPFRLEQAGDGTVLREALRAAGFREEALSDVLQRRSERGIDVAYVMRRTAEASSFHSLVRLFVLGLTLPLQAVRVALSPAALDWAMGSGLLEREEDALRAVACLRPWRGFFLLSDFLPPADEPLPPHFVMSGTSASSISLTRLTPRKRVRRVLDLGTGAGTHALLAAGHADRVVATDTNPRALNFAAMNARLNGIDNVSFRQGSLFEPVAGEQFDLVVSNPPFIISPESRDMFRTAGLEGDSVSEIILRDAPAHLLEGGSAVSLISWHHDDEADWAARPSAWVEGSGCDLWLLRATSEDPLNYAAHSLRQTERIGSPAYAQLLDEWVEFYREREFVKLALGAAILRKRAATRHWVHCEDLGAAVVETDAGEQLERVFAAEDFLVDASDDELLDSRVALHPAHILEQQLVAGENGWVSQSLVLKPAGGIEHRAGIDARVLVFLSHCDGSRTVRESIAAIASNDGISFSAAASLGLPLVRGLLRAGFLVVQR